MRYNYVLSAALDSSVALGILVVFFTLQLPKVGVASKRLLIANNAF
jgi:hypothetical protein